LPKLLVNEEARYHMMQVPANKKFSLVNSMFLCLYSSVSLSGLGWGVQGPLGFACVWRWVNVRKQRARVVGVSSGAAGSQPHAEYQTDF
jgi:hypothetical protein